MMTGASVLARIVPLQRALLLAIAFEDGGIQIQAVAIAAGGQPLHLPLGQRVEETMHVAHAKTPEEIADGVVNGNTRPKTPHNRVTECDGDCSSTELGHAVSHRADRSAS